MKYQQLQISTKEAEKIVLKIYNINGNAASLPGELDFNFKIKDVNGNNFVLKISRPDQELENLDFQQELLSYISKYKDIIAPKPILDKKGRDVSEILIDEKKRKVRLLTWISGRLWADISPQNEELRFVLGVQTAKLANALKGFQHQHAQREFQWDIAQGLWTTNYIHMFSLKNRVYLTYFQDKFKDFQNSYQKLQKGVVHNDANDKNILVYEDIKGKKSISLIDYGDAIYTQIINDLAVVCTYAIMDVNNPLQAATSIVKGYHESYSLSEKELQHLYVLIGMRLVISLTKSAINKEKEPENKYLLRSEKSGWELIKKWYAINEEFAYLNFRNAIGINPHPNSDKILTWVKDNSISINTILPSVQFEDIIPLNLSVSSEWGGHETELNDIHTFQFKLDQYQRKHLNKLISGGYLEPRFIYNNENYERIGNYGRENRCIHLGTDFWLLEGTPIHAAFEGELVTVTNDDVEKGYGGLVILKHLVDGIIFYTLYGHLSPKSIVQLKIGDKIKSGEFLGVLGNHKNNGGWASHLHFQILLTLLDYSKDFPGACYYSELAIWKSISPNPNIFFKHNSLKSYKDVSNKKLVNFRKQHLGKSMSLLYDSPIKMVRGSGIFLIDQFGQKYMDTVNNVAHVGHECIEVVKAGQRQMALINTNTRYLHEKINTLTEKILKTLPPELSVLHFVNSGSEANELAIRMVKAYTNSQEMIVSEYGYHGNTNACVAISSYKFDGKGGKGKPNNTHVFPLPDTFRGKYKGPNKSIKYVDEVKRCIEGIEQQGKKVGGFIIEPIISCGGQIELPEDFLKSTYREVRKAGGLCISDEVQVGCGRVGETFWGFQLHNVIPDIITIGKPLGNGHPIAAVVCTQKVASAFANGMEYFNTFGGNPVSCAIGGAVLTYIEENNLQANALEVGNFLKNELKKLAIQYPIIGNVRGKGLFLGVEFVDKQLKPLPKHANYVVQRMKDFRILMSTDGPDNNVLKIKPPIIFSRKNAEELIFYLNKVLADNFMNIHP